MSDPHRDEVNESETVHASNAEPRDAEVRSPEPEPNSAFDDAAFTNLAADSVRTEAGTVPGEPAAVGVEGGNASYAATASTQHVTNGDRWRQSLVLISILVTIALNGLANILPLMGRFTGDISDAFPTPFTPATYVFAIWGVIYVALVIFGVWQARPAQAQDERLRAAAPWVVYAGAFNIAWLVLWHAERVVLSTIPIIGLLVALLIAYERLRGGPNGPGIRWAARVPFGIYLGWASVATIANTAISGWALDWRGAPLSAEAWALIVIVVATLIGLRMLQVRGDAAFALVLVWAFVGIAVRSGLPGALPYGALIAAALLLGGAVGRMVRPNPAL